MIVIDIETNLLHNHIWCAGVAYEGGMTRLFKPDDILELQDLVEQEDYVVAHNGVTFDFPKLAELWGIHVPPEKQVDTLIMSKLHNAGIEGGHSLQAWGERMGKTMKQEFDLADFDEGYTEKMGKYCVNDTIVCLELYLELKRRLKRDGFSGQSLQIEHDIARLTYQQKVNGFKLDIDKATKLFVDMSTRMLEIEGILKERFPPIVTERWSEKTGKRLKDSIEVFNVGSRQQVARRLQTLGAVFKEETATGHPVVNEKTLSAMSHIPEAALVLEYLTCQKGAGMVDSWLAAVGDDGRVHGNVQTLGAATGRMTHSSPNMAQIPSAHEFRECWTVDEGRRLVGADAAQLELRLLAHYMQDPEYIKQILEGDIHTYNQNAAGLATRDEAKTFIYALIYGAGDGKIGQIAGGGSGKGKALKSKFKASLPAYKELADKVNALAESAGVVPGLDGRRIRLRQVHAALNYLLQGAGAIIMKKAAVLLMDLVDKNGWDAKLVAQVHDEFQLDCAADVAHAVGQAAVDCIVAAGVHFNTRCPMDGEYKVGTSWADTH